MARHQRAPCATGQDAGWLTVLLAQWPADSSEAGAGMRPSLAHSRAQSLVPVEGGRTERAGAKLPLHRRRASQLQLAVMNAVEQLVGLSAFMAAPHCVVLDEGGRYRSSRSGDVARSSRRRATPFSGARALRFRRRQWPSAAPRSRPWPNRGSARRRPAQPAQGFD